MCWLPFNWTRAFHRTPHLGISGYFWSDCALQQHCRCCSVCSHLNAIAGTTTKDDGCNWLNGRFMKVVNYPENELPLKIIYAGIVWIRCSRLFRSVVARMAMGGCNSGHDRHLGCSTCRLRHHCLISLYYCHWRECAFALFFCLLRTLANCRRPPCYTAWN